MMTSNKLDSTGGSKRIVMPQNMFYDSKIVEQNHKQTKFIAPDCTESRFSTEFVYFFSNLSFSLDRPKN